MKIRKILFVLITLLLVAACSSAPDKSDGELRKAAETNTALGQQYMDRGQYEVALEKLKRAVGFDKTYAPAHTLLGFLYETIGEMSAAESEYRLAVKYDPADGDVNNNLGAFLCRTGRPGEGEPYFETAFNDPFYATPQLALANAGSCALDRGELDNAESYLRQSLEYDQRMAAALLPMAEVSYRKGSYLRARAFLQRFEAVSGNNEESLRLGAMIEAALGDEESAERYRRKLQEQYPGKMRAGDRAGQVQG